MGENREAGWLIVVLRFPSGALKNSALALDQLPMANSVTKDPKISDFKVRTIYYFPGVCELAGLIHTSVQLVSQMKTAWFGMAAFGIAEISPVGLSHALAPCTCPTCLPGRLAQACSQASLHMFSGQSQRNKRT